MSFIRVMGLNVVNDDLYQRYREGMLPVLASHGGTFVHDFRVQQLLVEKNASLINRVFGIRFPSRRHMQAFFADSHYLAVREKYFASAVESVTTIALAEEE